MHEKIPNIIKIINAYGADTTKWPQEYGNLKQIYQQEKNNPNIEEAVKNAEHIDAILKSDQQIAMPENLNEKITASIKKYERQNKYNQNPIPIKQQKTNIPINPILLAASFIIGLYIGNTTDIADPIIHTLIPQSNENQFNEIISIQSLIEDIIS